MTELLHKAYIGIGANLGDPIHQCQKAIEAISQISGVTTIKVSSLYHSEPQVLPGTDVTQVPWYVNAVVFITTSLSLDALFQELEAIEHHMGRVRNQIWESRIIDLDLLAYDREIIKTSRITLPHPGIEKRAFVLEPLKEIDPEWTHPVCGLTASSLCDNLSSQLKIQRLCHGTH